MHVPRPVRAFVVLVWLLVLTMRIPDAIPVQLALWKYFALCALYTLSGFGYLLMMRLSPSNRRMIRDRQIQEEPISSGCSSRCD